jgi:ribonuclease P protein component
MRGARAHAIGRLTKRPQFVAAASGRRFHTERMTVQGRLREDAGAVDDAGLRFGFTITKRVGHATERNRIRRRLRAAAREAAPAHAGARADIVVIGRREALAADYRLLVDDLSRALATVTRPRAGRAEATRSPTTPSKGDESRGPHHA